MSMSEAKNYKARWAGIWTLALILIAGAIWGALKFAPTNNVNQAISIDTVTQDDWVKGNKNAKAVMIEYSDFECPACRAYQPLLAQLFQDFPEDFALVFRHFPLNKIHPNADIAARAAEAAGKQNKFWEMHDLLFDRQADWVSLTDPQNIFADYATELGLNREVFLSDLLSDEIRERVTAHTQSGNKAKLKGTPTFFLNGKALTNPSSYDEFKSIITNAINTP